MMDWSEYWDEAVKKPALIINTFIMHLMNITIKALI